MKFLALVSLVATLGTQSFAQTCGNLCSPEFWNTATTQEIATAIDSVDVNARNELGRTPLHIAAAFGTPENIAALLEAGADGTAEDDQGETPWDWAQDNESIQGTTAYWALNDARFR